MSALNNLQLATAADQLAIVDLLISLNLPTIDLPESLNNFVVAKRDTAVIGTCGLEVYGTMALLRSLAVTPDYHGQGLGNTLLLATLELAKEKGVLEIYLITNTAANFFAKRGFNQVERTRVPVAIQSTTQFSSVCPSTATIMNRQTN